jgi:hypothetical protein
MTASVFGLFSTAFAVQAADTQAVWDGILVITQSSPQCAGFGGTSIGDKHVSVFRPKIKGTDTPTSISILHTLSAAALENASEATTNQMNGLGTYAGRLITIRALAVGYGGTYSFSIKPATIKASTKSLTIVGVIDNYFNHAGCSVDFEAAYAQAPG